ncbi:MAG TPA: ABC transporter permease, partial [Vicinamibacterales bacterium]|nr:ABC transporter permease [Vicinamibacterales bacterium]
MWDRLRTWSSRAWAWARMRRVDEDFTEELEAHTSLLIEDNLRRGMSAEAAARDARLRLGGLTQLRESNRDQRGLPLLDQLAQDLRYTTRMFVKAPGFTLFAGAALALGIGATTAVFNVADAVLLRPLPYSDPSRLVVVWQDDTAFGFPHNNSNPWMFLQWKQRNHGFEDMAAVSRGSFNLTGSSDPEYLQAHIVTANLFRLLGIDPAVGRTFNADDGRVGQPATVVLSYGFWVRRFGADSGTVGRDLVLNGAKYTVVGVMPSGFQFVDPAIDIWVPAQWTPELIESRKFDHFLTIVARLRPGVSLPRASADMFLLARQIASGDVTDTGAVLVPLREHLTGDVGAALLILLGAVSFVLLIACANVANLLLARGSVRNREMAVRLAVGASRRRVVEQMLVESVVLSCLAGAVGLCLGVGATDFLSRLIPQGLAMPSGIPVNWTLLAFTAAISIATGILFGILPALRCSQVNLVTSLRQGSPQGGGGGHRLRTSLVIGEVAAAMILLSAATLMIRSLERLLHRDAGFTAAHVLTLRTPLPRPKYAEAGRRSAFYRDALQRIASVPGVVAAGYTTFLPLANAGGGTLVSVENHPTDRNHQRIANVRVVSPDYFREVGMTLRRGRLLNASDAPESLEVVVINDTMARTYWQSDDPIGHRFKRGTLDAKAPWYTVVGIVADMRQGGMNVPVRPEAYFSFEQFSLFPPDSLAVRTSGDPLDVAAAVRQQIWAVDKEQPVAAVMTLEQLVTENVSPVRVQTTLLGGFAAI